MQLAVDAAHMSFAALLDRSDGESQQMNDVLACLGAQAAKTAAAGRVGTDGDQLGRWKANAATGRWTADGDGPWYDLTRFTLWDDDNVIVTRLQEFEQAQVLICDPAGVTEWAWPGRPQALLEGHVTRPNLLAALGATVPVSHVIARAVREQTSSRVPDGWAAGAAVLLRGLVPMTVTDIAGLCRLDPTLGLVRTEAR